ncbi:sensor histidine kinase [Niabella insulamsoli]|uniref:sensor histidine kinase n=1 Tax=Niabella insulamsoli TaxID=3144874 RepID=UPI0031FDBC7F
MAYKKRDYKHLKEKKRLEEDFNNQLLKSKIEVQEQTFSQIGKELHDNVAQLLSTSRMLIGLAERKLKSPPDALITANATIGEAINELRSLSKSLDEEWLSQFNLLVNLRAEIARINSSKTINASLDALAEPRLSSSRQIILFRIIQEALQNALRHSQCKSVAIHLEHQEAHIAITISDDGIGLNHATGQKGLGLKNMEYRTKLLGGSIQFMHTNPGTSIQLLIPENTATNED